MITVHKIKHSFEILKFYYDFIKYFTRKMKFLISQKKIIIFSVIIHYLSLNILSFTKKKSKL